MKAKRKDPFRTWTGFKFGLGFIIGACLGMYFMYGLEMLFRIIMSGLGFSPGVFG